MTLELTDESREKLDIPAEEIAREVLAEASRQSGAPFELQISMLITDEDEVRELNHAHRGIDSPTDVLSFPMNEFEIPGDFSSIEESDAAFDPQTGELMLGDIVICAPYVRKQAALYGHSVKREFAFLTAHSFFHLTGYDHMTGDEASVMEKLQEDVLSSLGITR